MKTYIRLSGISGSSAKQPSTVSLADWPRRDRQNYLTRPNRTCIVLSGDSPSAAAPVRSGWRRFFSHARRLRDVLLSTVVFATLANTALAQPKKNETTAVGPLTLSAEQLQWLIAKMTMRQSASLGAQLLNQKNQTSGAAVQNQTSATRSNAASPAVKPALPPAQNSGGNVPIASAESPDMPDIRFTAVDGRLVDLARLRGKVVLIDYWATWCGPCIGEIPNVAKTYNQYHDKGFEIVGISFDTSEAALRQVTLAKDMPWPQYFDGKSWQNTFGVKYGIHSIPTMWLIDQQGRIVTKNARANLAEQVAKLLRRTVLAM